MGATLAIQARAARRFVEIRSSRPSCPADREKTSPTRSACRCGCRPGAAHAGGVVLRRPKKKQGGAGYPARAWRRGASCAPLGLAFFRAPPLLGSPWRCAGALSATLPGGSGLVLGVLVVASSSPLVVSRGGSVLAALPWRRVAGSALAAGCCRWRVRASSRSFSGAVLAVGFPCFGRAAAFASAWSGWVGFPVAVSPRSSGGVRVWSVSVPVAAPVRPVVAGPVGAVSRSWFFRAR